MEKIKTDCSANPVVKELVLFVMTVYSVPAELVTCAHTSLSKVFKSVLVHLANLILVWSQMHVFSFFLHFSKNSFTSECSVILFFNVHLEYLETHTSVREPERDTFLLMV